MQTLLFSTTSGQKLHGVSLKFIFLENKQILKVFLNQFLMQMD